MSGLVANLMALLVVLSLWLAWVLRQFHRSKKAHARIFMEQEEVLRRHVSFDAELLEILRGVFPYVDDVNVMQRANARLKVALDEYRKESGDAVAH